MAKKKIGALAGEGLSGVDSTVDLDKPETVKPEPARTVRIENRRKKRNMFLADAVRMEDDVKFLNKEIGKREYKGKIVKITTIKHCEVTPEGDWLTEFIIDLKA